MKHRIIYHKDCVDGFASMTLLQLYLGGGIDIKLIPLQYHQRDDFIKNRADEFQDAKVWVVDFCFTPDQLSKVIDLNTQITIIDHHEKAFQEWKNIDTWENLDLILNMEYSGAVGVRNYIRNELAKSDEYANTMVELTDLERILDSPIWDFLSDYDLHTFKYFESHPIVKYIAAQGYIIGIPSEEKRLMFLDIVDACHQITPTPMAAYKTSGTWSSHLIVQMGVALQDYDEVMVATLLSNTAMMSICGYDVPVANVPYSYRDIAGTMLNRRYKHAPFSATYCDEFDTSQGIYVRRWSLRSEVGKEVNLNRIMEEAGIVGGGHPTAAGFVEIIDTKLMGIQK